MRLRDSVERLFYVEEECDGGAVLPRIHPLHERRELVYRGKTTAETCLCSMWAPVLRQVRTVLHLGDTAFDHLL